MTDLFSKTQEHEEITLRDYQEDAADAVISYLKTNPGQNPIICAATGTGKSVIIARIIQRIKKANPQVRVMVGAHVAELLEQNSKKLAALMPDADIGIYSAGLGRDDTKNDILFAGIQSVYRVKPETLGIIHVLIVDEVHTISKKDKSMWASLIAALRVNYPGLKIIGLSATPFRLDSGLITKDPDDPDDTALFDEIVYDYGIGKAVQDGYLCSLTTKATETKYNIDGIKKLGGEYNLKELEAATNTDDLNRRAVAEMIIRAADRKSWLIFCNGVDHSFKIRDELRRMGITAETVTGDTPDWERAKILAYFKAGKVRAVTNNAVWTTGIDVPNVDMIGMLRHTLSGGLLLQMAGRGTRTTIDLSPYTNRKERLAAIAASDKPNCLFLDFAGNIKRHGFLDMIGPKPKGKKGDGVAPMKDCPECFTICHAAAKSCKDCGYVFPVNTETKIDGAYGGSVLSGPDIRDVIGVSYHAHNLNKEGKTPCMMVKYQHPDGSNTRDYICLQHDGFAYTKAIKWWNDRQGPAIEGFGEKPSIAFIIENKMYEPLMVPKSITVVKEKGFDKIVKYDGLHKPEPRSALPYVSESSTDFEDFDIPF